MTSLASQTAPDGAIPEEAALFPRWALVAAAVMVVAGLMLYLTREPRQRAGYASALREAQIKISPTEDGLARDFGDLNVDSGQKEVLEVFGQARSNPALALAVFQEVMGNSDDRGRALACRLGFYLIHDGALDPAGRLEILQTIVAQLDPGRDGGLRRVAQTHLKDLLVLSPVEKKEVFSKVDAAPPQTATADPKDGMKEGKKPASEPKVELLEVTWLEKKWLQVDWSSPDLCLAWWKQFGSKASWSPELKRFKIEP